MLITLPLWPVTKNTIWRCVGGRILLSRRGRQFFADGCRLIGTGHETIRGPVTVTVDLRPPDRRKRDIDGPIPGILDLLTRSAILADDSQVDHLTVSRGTIKKGGEFTVEIQEHANSP